MYIARRYSSGLSPARSLRALCRQLRASPRDPVVVAPCKIRHEPAAQKVRPIQCEASGRCVSPLPAGQADGTTDVLGGGWRVRMGHESALIDSGTTEPVGKARPGPAAACTRNRARQACAARCHGHRARSAHFFMGHQKPPQRNQRLD